MAVRHITAGGGVLFKRVEEQLLVLLIFRNGVWDLPKGKKEDDETVEQCAVREVAEEVGCALPENLGKLTETYHEYTRRGETIGKSTHWFVMQVKNSSDAFTPQREEGIERIAWFPLGKAQRIVGYDNLLTVLKSFKKWAEEHG